MASPVGIRLGVLPGERASVGLSALYGSGGKAGETNNRLPLNADYTLEPAAAGSSGEANYARTTISRMEATRAGQAMVLVTPSALEHFGLAARAEVADDKDGARTGQPQTLTSDARPSPSGWTRASSPTSSHTQQNSGDQPSGRDLPDCPQCGLTRFVS